VLTYLLDWVGLLARWLHVVAGIAWIGVSFYFVWLENHLRPSRSADPIDPEVGGEVWTVHDGGIYRAQKYRVAPSQLPATLHWFYWEAYTSWLSGFALLCLLYFLRAEAYLIDPAVASLSKAAAIAIALAALITSWLVYDALCRSRLAQHTAALAGALVVLFGALAWGLCHLFSGRGAFMIFGASLGTIMAANVAHVIVPAQRQLLRARQEGREVDPAPGLRGRQRSFHNTYFTLPVLFAMISNHYAVTYGARNNWLVLIALSFGGACLRGWFVARHTSSQNRRFVVALPGIVGIATLAAVILALAPVRTSPLTRATPAPAVDSVRAQTIVQQRCAPCHAAMPTQPGFSAAPNGLVLQSLDQLEAHLPEAQRQLTMRTMPLGNVTMMTEDERALLLMWIGHRRP
jgi:uncharacterized membrane protein